MPRFRSWSDVAVIGTVVSNSYTGRRLQHDAGAVLKIWPARRLAHPQVVIEWNERSPEVGPTMSARIGAMAMPGTSAARLALPVRQWPNRPPNRECAQPHGTATSTGPRSGSVRTAWRELYFETGA